MCECVCLTSSREGLPSRDTNRRAITPLNACDVIPPPDSAHQPLPGEMLVDGCPLGNVYGTATFSSRLLESGPARHSVTLRCRLGQLPFLPFQISEESDTRSQCNYARKTPILTQTKFRHDFILSRAVGMEKYRCFAGTTRENHCSLSTRNAKDKRQSGIVLSPPGGGFELWDSWLILL